MRKIFKRCLIIAFGVFCLTLMSGASLMPVEKLQLLDIQDFEITEAQSISSARQLVRVIPVYNHADEKEFALYDYGNDGFILMHRATGTILEQVNGRAPFSNSTTTKKYYLGMGNYMEEQDGGLMNFSTGEIYNKNTLSDYKDHVVEFTNKIKEHSEIKSLSMRKNAATSTDPIFPGVENGTLKAIKSVTNSEVFGSMTSIRDYGWNSSGSCVAVSHNILLQFQAKTRDYAIMPAEAEESASLVPQRWVDECAGYKVQDCENKNKYYDASIDISNDSVGEAAHKYLIRLSNVKQFGLSKSQITTAMQSYLNELPCINMEYTSESFVSSAAAHVNITNLIDLNYPVAVMIDSASKTTHSVVAYGYTNKTDGYLRVHYGWGNEDDKAYSDCYVNDDLLTSFTYIGHLSNPEKNHNLQITEWKHKCLNSNCFASEVSHSNRKISTELHKCSFCNYERAHDYHCTPDGHLCNCDYLVTTTYDDYSNYLHSCKTCGTFWFHEFITLGDDDSRQYCIKCLRVHEHSYANYTYFNEAIHTKTCVDLVCNHYTTNEKHNLLYEQISGGHNEWCENCSYHQEGAKHKIEFLPKNETHHHQACGCGYVKILNNTPSKHNFKYDWLKAKYYCTGCGYIKE